MQDQNLTQLYLLHEQGELDDLDPRWQDVQDLLHSLAKSEVTKIARDLFGPPLDDRIEDVYTALLCKFVQLKFSHVDSDGNDRRKEHGVRGSIEPLLRMAARNDLASAFRKSRSPTAVQMDEDDRSARHTSRQGYHSHSSRGPSNSPLANGVCDEVDLFLVVRQAMPMFRFAQYQHLREAMLAYFLTQLRHPPMSFLQSFTSGPPRLDKPLRDAVYNAAVFDINRAVMAHAA